mgnify:CR=1 FL=1
MSEFHADNQYTGRTPSAMANFDIESIEFNANSATVTVNDVERDSNSSDDSCDSEENGGSGHSCGNYYRDDSQESQGAQYLSTDTAERQKNDWGKPQPFELKNSGSNRSH